MMIRLPRKYHSDDDDYAPLDYQFVGSVNEGQRRREAEAIHRSANAAVIRRRAQPDERVDEYGTRARHSPAAMREKPRGMEKQLPSDGYGARVQRTVYPEGYGSREDELDAGANEIPAPARDSGRRERVISAFAASDDIPSPRNEGMGQLPPEEPMAPQFDAPVAPEIPEWLRVAKQNNMPLEGRQLRPRVIPAPAVDEPQSDPLGRPMLKQKKAPTPASLPQTASDYADAGYPPQLLQQQEVYDQKFLAELYGSKRHGAQRAVQSDPRAGRVGRAERVQRSIPQGEQDARNPWEQAPMPERPYHAPYGGRETLGDLAYAPAEYMQSANLPLDDAPAAGRSTRRSGRNRVPAARDMAQEWDDSPQWDEPSPEAASRRIPWLGIASVSLAFMAVLLWILQISFANRAEDALNARTQAEEEIIQKHPYKYRDLIETQAQVNNLHPAFIAAIVLNESSFRPDAESSVGARGLMQVMPDTAEWIHGKIGEGEEYDFDHMYDAATNVRYACWYMNFLSDRFRGDPVLVAAGFHAGQGTVQNWLNDSRYSADNQTIALAVMKDGETKEYVTKVLNAYAVYKRLFYENVGG